MADTVSDVAEVLDVPEKEIAEKAVEEVEDVDEDSGDVQEDSEGDSEEVKENGTSGENGDGVDHPVKNGNSNGVAKDSDVIASKRKSGGGDAPDGLLKEGASPEKKAKLDEPVEVDANGEAEVAA